MYDAFISYSQAADKPIAQALRSVIQTIGKPWWKVRGLNVFVDATSLSAAPDLWRAIAARLDEARYLILLASPQSAASPWVDREVAHFLAAEGKGVERILIGLTEGELAWDAGSGDFRWSELTPLPPSLEKRFPAEPLWVDLRPYRDHPETASRSDQAFVDVALNLAAAIRGVDKADIYSEEVKRQRRNLSVAYAIAAGMTGLGIAAGVAAWFAVANEQRATREADRATRNFGIAKDVVDRVIFDVAQGVRGIEGMRIESVRTILTRAETAVNRLSEAAPEDREVLSSRSAMLMEFGTTYLDYGDTEAGLNAYREAVQIGRRLAGEQPENVHYRRELSLALRMVGDAEIKAGKYAEAFAVYDESLKLSRELAGGSQPDDARMSDVAFALKKMGRLRMLSGDLPLSLTAYDEALVIERGLVAKNPENKELQRGLAGSLTNIGDLNWRVTDNRAAIDAYGESLAIERKLTRAYPQEVEFKDNIVKALNNLGRVQLAIGDTTAALASLEEASALAGQMWKLDPGNNELRARMFMTISSLAQAKLMSGDPPAAVAAFEEAIVIGREVAAKDEANRDWKSSLALMLFMLQLSIQDTDRKRDLLTEAIAIVDGLEARGDVPAELHSIAGVMRQTLAGLK